MALQFGLGIFAVLAIFTAAFFARSPEAQAQILAYWASVKPEPGFRPGVLIETPLSVQAHVVGVVTAIVFGVIIVLLPKGTGLHRILGWVWVLAMALVAVTSIVMIFDFGDGISPLHAFTAITVVSLTGGLMGIRRGNVRAHAGHMIGLLFGGLVIAGVFAFIPGRTMWQVFFGG